MGTVVLDASVIIGFLSPRDAHHDTAVQLAREWGTPDTRVLIPATVYSEILVHAVREGREEHVDSLLHSMNAQIVPLDRVIAREAAVLRANNRSLRLPDAFVLATAQEYDAPLFTLDQQLQRIAESGTH